MARAQARPWSASRSRSAPPCARPASPRAPTPRPRGSATRTRAGVDRLLRQHVRAQLRVVLAGGQRAVEVRLGVVDAGDRAALGQPQPRANAVAARERVELGREQIRHPLPLAGDLEVAGEVEQPLAPRRRVRRRQAQRVLGQVDRLPGPPARGRPAAAAATVAASPSSGTRRRERQVECAQLLVGDDGRELQMELAPLAGVASAPSRPPRGADATAHRSPSTTSDARRRRRPRPRPGPRSPRAAGRAGRRSAPGRAAACARAGASCATRVPSRSLDRVGHRQVVAERRRPVPGERPPDLEREQRVAERASRTRRRRTWRGRLSRTARPGAARVAPKLRGPTSRRVTRSLERALERGTRRRAARRGGTRPPRRRGGAPRTRAPRRRSVEPLDVVDATSSGSRAASDAQRVQEAERDRVCLRRRRGRLGAKQRDLERAELRRRQPAQLVRADTVQQVDQRREREPGLGAAPSRRENRVPRAARPRCPPPRAWSCRSPARP